MHISLAEYVIVAAVITVGALVQGTIGFGLNLTAAAVVGFVAPQLMPGAMVVVGLPLSALIAWRERRHIDWLGVRRIALARIPSTAVGALVVASVSTKALGGIIGAAVIVACVIAAVTVPHRIGPTNTVAAGLASGFMDVTAATGGPPLALLYQHRPIEEVRPTLGVSFVIGTAISLGGLAMEGAVHWWQLLVALTMMPSLALGMFLSGRLGARLANVSLRPIILGFSAVAGVAAVLRSVS